MPKEKRAIDLFAKLLGREMHGHPQIYELLLKMADTHDRKNSDYSGGEKGLAFRNFRLCEIFGISAYEGVLVRLNDKQSRIQCIESKGVSRVKDESVEDTFLDQAVYSLIAMILRREWKKLVEEMGEEKARIFLKKRALLSCPKDPE